jgi:hypothetical protein
MKKKQKTKIVKAKMLREAQSLPIRYVAVDRKKGDGIDDWRTSYAYGKVWLPDNEKCDIYELPPP